MRTDDRRWSTEQYRQKMSGPLSTHAHVSCMSASLSRFRSIRLQCLLLVDCRRSTLSAPLHSLKRLFTQSSQPHFVLNMFAVEITRAIYKYNTISRLWVSCACAHLDCLWFLQWCNIFVCIIIISGVFILLECCI